MRLSQKTIDTIKLLEFQCRTYLELEKIGCDQSAKLAYRAQAEDCLVKAREVYTNAVREYSSADETAIINVA